MTSVLGVAAEQLAPATNSTPPDSLHEGCAYVICTNPRSGSWLLSEALSATGVAGHPREWFNVLEEQEQRARCDRDAGDTSPAWYLRHVVAEGSTPNGAFGLKLHYYQLSDLARQLRRLEGYALLPVEQAIQAAFPAIRYLWLTRTDRPRQAISYSRATQSETWWRLGSEPASGTNGACEPRYDPRAIAELERLLIDNDAGWLRFFERCDARPLVVTYEQLSTDYAGTVSAVLRWLGVAGSSGIEVAPPRLQRQADPVTEDWLRRYEQSKRDGLRLERPHPGARPARAQPPLASGSAAGAADGEPQADPRSPLFAASRPAPGTIPRPWRQWLAKAVLQGTAHQAIVDTMARQGFEADVARAEIAAALEHPYLRAAGEMRDHLTHGIHILGTLDRLWRLQPWARAVPRVRRPARATFCERFYAANRPVVLTELMGDWPALTRWTPDYLRSALGDEEIEVMSRREGDPDYESHPDRHRERMRFADFVDRVYSAGPSNDCYVVANNHFFEQPAGRALLADITAFPEYLDEARLSGRCFLWFGPAGTVTPLHHDPCNILLAQVSGRKRVRLVPSTQWQHVYTSDTWVSDVDCERPDYVRRPRFCNATMLDVTLAPGEVLFVPVGWSHHVRALDPSISVSFTNFVFPNEYPR